MTTFTSFPSTRVIALTSRFDFGLRKTPVVDAPAIAIADAQRDFKYLAEGYPSVTSKITLESYTVSPPSDVGTYSVSVTTVVVLKGPFDVLSKMTVSLERRFTSLVVRESLTQVAKADELPMSELVYPAVDEDDGRYIVIEVGYGVPLVDDEGEPLDYCDDVDVQYELYESVLPEGKTFEDLTDLYVKYGTLHLYFRDDTSCTHGDIIGDTLYDDFDFKHPGYLQVQRVKGEPFVVA